MRVKICGITRTADAKICEDLGAHALGFIFYPESPRYIRPEEAAEIIAQTGPFIDKVGVFVNESAERVNEIAARCRLSMVQLHGEESPEYIRQIHVPVIKGWRVSADFDYQKLNQYRDCFVLLDAYVASGYGGTGKTFDWSRIPGEIRSKLILAGGVSVENIAYIYQHIQPAAVDLSSSVESAPGVKDNDKIRVFMNAVKKIQTKG